MWPKFWLIPVFTSLPRRPFFKSSSFSGSLSAPDPPRFSVSPGYPDDFPVPGPEPGAPRGILLGYNSMKLHSTTTVWVRGLRIFCLPNISGEAWFGMAFIGAWGGLHKTLERLQWSLICFSEWERLMGALDPDCVTYCPGLQPPSSVLGAEGGWGVDSLLFLPAVGPSVFFF